MVWVTMARGGEQTHTAMNQGEEEEGGGEDALDLFMLWSVYLSVSFLLMRMCTNQTKLHKIVFVVITATYMITITITYITALNASSRQALLHVRRATVLHCIGSSRSKPAGDPDGSITQYYTTIVNGKRAGVSRGSISQYLLTYYLLIAR